jgi:anti-sigma factor (TIGR02949 family)
MNCGVVRRHLDAYMDGEVDPTTQIEFERHLAGCAGCQELLSFSRQVKAEVRRSCLATRAPAALRERICAAMAEADRQAKKGAAIRFLPLRKQVAFAVAAAAAVLMALTWGIGTSGEQGPAARAATMPMSMLEDVVRVHSAELPADVHAAEPDAVTHYFRDKVQFPVRPAEFERPARLLGGRLSNVRDRRAAALYYDVGGRRLTVVVFDGPGLGSDGGMRARMLGRELYYRQVQGYTVPVRRQDGLTYAFTGDMDRRQVLRLAASARVRY